MFQARCCVILPSRLTVTIYIPNQNISGHSQKTPVCEAGLLMQSLTQDSCNPGPVSILLGNSGEAS